MTTLSFLKFRIIAFSILFFHSILLGYCGEKKLYFFGGGGEPEGPSTIFDGHINLVSQFINTKDSTWSATQSFNGGHEQTEKQLQSKLPNASALGSFNEKNYLQALSNLEGKLVSGELKSGDQLLLIMDTHGAVNSTNEKSHSVALSQGTAENLETLSGASIVSMDKLEKILKLASVKGVKLALLDLSCFSGNTLKIANKNTCVISATGENQYGYNEVRSANDNSPYSTFGGRFLERMKSGSNLEDIFLDARLVSQFPSPDFPMISTDTGFLVNDLIYQMITPYLLYNYASITNFSESYDVKNLAQALCKTENQYSEINKRIDEIANFTSLSKKLFDTTKLKKALLAYRKYQIYYEKALSDAQKAGDEVKDIIRRDYPDKAKLFDKEDGLAILTVNRENSLKMYKQLADEEKSKWNEHFYQKIYDELLEKDAISKKVSLKMSAQSKININNFDEIFKKSGNSKKLAENVSAEAINIYDKLYRANANKNKESNPCKDFVL
jgi:hypothetical protein